MTPSANEPEGDDYRGVADAYARSLTLLARNKGYLHAILRYFFLKSLSAGIEQQ